MLKSRTLRGAILIALWVSFSALAFFRVSLVAAQQSSPAGSISGQVTDPFGGAVSKATVTLTSLKTGQSRAVTTDSSGKFEIESFPPGKSSLQVTAAGFRSAWMASLSITAGQILTEHIVLTVGAAPETVSAAAVEAIAPQEPSAAGVVGPSEPSSSLTSLVTVSENAVAGPMGYVLTPSLGAAVQSQTAQQQAFAASQRFNFPSIVFYISAAPLVNLPSTAEATKIQAAQETDRNPLWLDASFTLTFFDQNGPLPRACSDGSVQVLGLMPQQTVSAMKNQTIADVASAATNDAAGALASFYPGSAGEITSATQAMNVVFQDIFPPKPVAYEYSNMSDNCNFGWYFRPNTSATAGSSGEASILGIQTGIVLLRTSKNITKISVNGRSLSAWNKSPNADGKQKLFVSNDKLIGSIELPNSADIDYDNLTSLAMFPALIPKSEAMQILHVKLDADFVAFATANKLVGTNPTFDYVTNASLSAFLNLQAPPAASQPKPKQDADAGAKGKGTAGTKPVPAPTPKPKPAGSF